MKYAKRFLTVVAGAGLTVGLCGVAGAVAASSKPAPPKSQAGVAASSSRQDVVASSSRHSTAAARTTAANRAGDGLNMGIGVHGHWLIEVKNPDGKVTARREFENLVQPTGEAFLASLLAGNNSPGGLSVLLNGKGATLCPGGGCPLPNNGNGNALIYSPEPGPCMPLGSIADPPLYVTYGNNVAGSVCLITGSSTFLGINASGDFANQPTGFKPPVSLNLSVSGPTFPVSRGPTSFPPPQLTLSGTVPVTSSSAGSVTDAETIFATCSAGTATTGCVNNLSFGAVVDLKVFTEKDLDGQNGDPAEVPYSPGQTIAVTVTFSFQ